MKYLSGWKTYAGAALIALGALNAAFGWVSPEVQNTVMGLGAALGLVGVRHAIATKGNCNA